MKSLEMALSDLKYLASYIIPALVYVGLVHGGASCYAALVFAFVIVPVAEFFFPSSEENLTETEAHSKAVSRFFDLLLYLNLPILYLLLYLFASGVAEGIYSSTETLGLVLSFGTLMGSSGINVAHELGHKSSWYARTGSILLLVPSLYAHFHIEHNLGHHKNVGTPLDPATARKDENLYHFWLRSALGSYLNAWKLEFKRLTSHGLPRWHYSNRMIIYSALEAMYLAGLVYVFGAQPAMLLAAAAVLSFLFLETINYVEHYGLSRKQLESGRYERVQPWHSWNSNHHLGRIILYELTRHSDHHYMAHKKYQLLDHHKSSPQLPYGYPTSMLLSMVPPLWFWLMNPRIEEGNKESA